MYAWGALKGDSPGPAGCGDSRIKERSEMTGLPLTVGGLQRQKVLLSEGGTHTGDPIRDTQPKDRWLLGLTH